MTLPLSTLGCLSSIDTAKGQIIPDNSLGAEKSVVNSNANTDRINGGARRGANLFHSFREFNVDEGRAALFSNPAGIDNIFSRVTGEKFSNILGTLGVADDGNANLFFMNPNGVFFGEKARLDMHGSFLASTANSFLFDGGLEFSASNPQAPPMLAINIPIGLRFRDNSGRITNRSVADDVGLQVDSGKTLSLVGGDVNLEGGKLTATGGRVELGGLAEPGTVGLEITDNIFKLNFPYNNLLANVTLADDARVNVRGGGGGDIAAYANILSMRDGGRLVGGVESTGNGGNITVNSNEINISGVGESERSSGIYQQVVNNASGNLGNITVNTNSFKASFDALVGNIIMSGATGNGGDINITAQNLSLTDGAKIGTSTFGEGNAGTVNINAQDSISLVGIGTGIYSDVKPKGVGNAGDIEIKAPSMSMRDRAALSSSTWAKQDTTGQPSRAGRVLLEIGNALSLQGSSNIFNNVEYGGVGQGGDVQIKTGSLSLLNGSQIQTLVRETENNQPPRRGNAGKVNIDVRDAVTIAGVDKDKKPSAVFSAVNTGVIGNSGDIHIMAGSLSLTEGGQLSSSNSGTGDAGKIFVQVGDSVSLESSSIFNNAESKAVGNAGDIEIKARSMSMRDKAELSSSTSAKQNIAGQPSRAGTVSLEVGDALSLQGSSNIFNNVEHGAVGQGGEVKIQARSLSLLNGSQIQTIVRGVENGQPAGSGNAGKVNIDVRDAVTIDGRITDKNEYGSSIFSYLGNTIGRAGDINIKTGSLNLLNGGQLLSSVKTGGQGNSGNVNIDVQGDVQIDGFTFNRQGYEKPSAIFTNMEEGSRGDGGNIRITSDAGSIFLNNRAYLQASTSGTGDAGKIFVQAKDSISLAGSGTAIYSDVNSKAVGNSGSVEIQARLMSIKDGASLNSNTYGTGDAGRVFVQAKDAIALDGGDIFSNVEHGAVGQGGEVKIQARSLSLLNGSQIQTSVRGAENGQPAGSGNAGKVNIDVRDAVTIDGRITDKNEYGSSIFSDLGNKAIGRAGDINIKTGSLNLLNGGQLQSSVKEGGQGNSGNVNVDVQGDVQIDGFTFSRQGDEKSSAIFTDMEEGSRGNGGNISITSDAGSIFLNNRAYLQASTSGTGDAGKVFVQAKDAISLDGTGIYSNVGPGGIGIGGDIDINARSLSLTDGAKIGAAVMRQASGPSAGRGKAGNININATDFVNISGVSSTPNRFANFSDSSKIWLTEGYSSGLFASAETGTTATDSKASGDISITTGNFLLTNGAVVDALTSNAGNGGKITINAKSFTATGGGQVLTTTRGSGRAGDIFLNISDGINLSGIDPNFNERLERVEQAIKDNSLNELPRDIVTNQGSASGIFANTSPDSVGDAGTITIDPRTLVIRDHAGIGVNSEGKGKGGDININSDNLTLDDQAFISAETASNQGGSIFLKIGDLLLLRRKSNISTNAGTAQAGGDGGNININSKFIVALPSEDSNITANAFTGRGGNVNISATSIFGMKYRKSPTLRSDITASSQFGITGNVTLNTPNVDPSHGLVELPKNVVDPTEQIAQNPCQRGLTSKFIITGRGGLPPSPNEATSSDTVRVDLVEPAPGGSRGAGEQRRSTSATLSGQGTGEKGKSSVTKSIVPAQGWIFDKNGEVMLTGYDPTGTGSQRPVNSDVCPVP
ncbi:filamentous hemagglutinin-like protein [Richelia sinica FACHB-800]|uniref:Filamentous hemagglutinin-like protein n=2 Tax=Richelia TaxID=98443 RepID=A0A975T4S9_9NOST|nr:filamentous hemagglutinin-like protein [Richelia sinica FACHB-800]